ncbi:MAG: hypothetical protein ACQEQH_04000 [Bacillota bacterium]
MNYLKELNNITKKDEIYLVGGSIRDYLLKRNIKDIDLLVFNDIKEIVYDIAKKIGNKVIVLDKERNIFRIVVGKDLFLDFSSPVGQDLYEDLGYRDFTINSMAVKLSKVDLNNGQIKIINDDIIDPFCGKDDLDNKVIRVVKKNAIKNDPLRMIRAFRFANNLGFEIDSKTKSIIDDDIHLIKEVKVERIKEELIKTFSYKIKIGILKEFFNSEIIYKLFNINFDIDNKKTNQIANILACLKKNNYIHKIDTSKYIIVLIIIFLDLVINNKKEVKSIEERLLSYTFSKNDVIIIRDYLYIIEQLINNYHEYINNNELIYDKLFLDKVNYQEIRYITNCYHLKEQNVLLIISEIIERLIKMKKWTKNKIANGDMVINNLNIKPGEKVGEILSTIKKKRALGILKNEEEIIHYIKSISIDNKNNL